MRPLLILLLTSSAFAAVHAAGPPHILLREELQYGVGCQSWNVEFEITAIDTWIEKRVPVVKLPGPG